MAKPKFHKDWEFVSRSSDSGDPAVQIELWRRSSLGVMLRASVFQSGDFRFSIRAVGPKRTERDLYARLLVDVRQYLSANDWRQGEEYPLRSPGKSPRRPTP